ncbi:MAG: HEAT repeat domain-containing protein [Anaerolineales bacterium]|nr:HEAT repeat domain-containing protein [Anaerolineales bacterium]
MTTPINPSDISLQDVLEALLAADKPFPPRFLNRLSDLEPEDLKRLEAIWPQVPNWRRKALLEDIEQLGDDDTLLSFEALAAFALQDSDAQVRLPAVRTLWEYENPQLGRKFLDLAEHDPDLAVRSAAASGLGRYVYLGEIEEIPTELLEQIEKHLLKLVKGGENAELQRSALESLGFSSRDEVPALIEKAYQSGQKDWIASALFAMGRSASQQWKGYVQDSLDSQHPVIRAEAARAAGELEITAAQPRLVELLDDPDDQTRSACIWSLSQLGGEGVHQLLEQLLVDTEDDLEREFIESAIDNLTFNEDMGLLPLFDLADAPPARRNTAESGYEAELEEAIEEDADDEFGEYEDLDEFSDEEDEWLDDEDEDELEDYAD